MAEESARQFVAALDCLLAVAMDLTSAEDLGCLLPPGLGHLSEQGLVHMLAKESEPPLAKEKVHSSDLATENPWAVVLAHL